MVRKNETQTARFQVQGSMVQGSAVPLAASIQFDR
jgi:hypothetical protein